MVSTKKYPKILMTGCEKILLEKFSQDLTRSKFPTQAKSWSVCELAKHRETSCRENKAYNWIKILHCRTLRNTVQSKLNLIFAPNRNDKHVCALHSNISKIRRRQFMFPISASVDRPPGPDYMQIKTDNLGLGGGNLAGWAFKTFLRCSCSYSYTLSLDKFADLSIDIFFLPVGRYVQM